MFLEFIRIFSGEVVGLTIFGTALLDLRMTFEVVFQAFCHVFALGDDANACGQVFQNLRHEQRIMGAAEDNGIDLWVKAHDLINALLYEVVGTRGVGLVVFHENIGIINALGLVIVLLSIALMNTGGPGRSKSPEKP